MPSKRTVVLILFFWLLTTAYVAYRDLWPRLFASHPPTIAIDLTDEAAQNVAIRWTIYRGDKSVGKLISHLHYDKNDDTFEFKNEYRQLELVVGPLKCLIPEFTSIDRITRDGELRSQSLEGRFEANLRDLKFEGKAEVRGAVVNGQLLAEGEISLPFGTFREKLDPVPVLKGQVLNPLQPINRFSDLKPGQSWYVQKNNPLEDAIAAIILKNLEKQGLKLHKPDQESEPLLAQVLPEAQELTWFSQQISCWVIEYRRDKPVARTWVKVSDNKVLKQEAFSRSEHMMIVRDR